MKKIILLTLMFGISFTNLSSQTNVYHPMLNDTSVEWTFFTSINNVDYIHFIKICGNIQIKNKFYYVLCDKRCQWNGSTCTYLLTDTLAFIREDTINKKVYGYLSWMYFHPDIINNFGDTTMNEFLLYDFDSISIGKVLNTVYQTSSITKPDTIGCIDSVQLLDNSYRKYFASAADPAPMWNGKPCGDPFMNLFWMSTPGIVIEGIGNIRNPFSYWHCGIPMFQCTYGVLLCYKRNQIPLLTITNIPSISNPCNIPTRVDYKSNLNFNYQVYPTLSNGILIINNQSTKDIDIEVYDVSNNLLLKYKPYYSHHLDLSNLNNGMYFIKTSNSNYSTWHKIIINH